MIRLRVATVLGLAWQTLVLLPGPPVASACDPETQPAPRARGFFERMFSFWDRRGTVDVVAVAHSERWIAVGGRDVGTGGYDDHGDVKIYNARTGVVLQRLALPKRIGYLAVSPDDALLAAGAEPNLTLSGRMPRWIAFYTVVADGTCSEVGRGSIDFRPQDAFAFVRAHFVAAGRCEISTWSTSDWCQQQFTLPRLHGFAGSPESALIATAAELDDCSDVVTISMLPGFESAAELAGRAPLVLLREGRLLAYCSHGGGIVLWDAENKKPRGMLPNSVGSWVAFRVSAAQNRLAALDDTGAVSIWQVGDSESTLVSHFLVPRAGDLAFVGDGTSLVVVTPWGKTVMEHRPDGSFHAVSRTPPAMELWSAGGQPLHRLDTGGGDRAAISGGTVVSFTAGSEDFMVWDVSDPGSPTLRWKDRWRAKPWIPLE